MKFSLLRFCDDQSAVSSLEYALLGSLIAVVIVVAVAGAGSNLGNLFVFVKDQVVLATK